MSLADLQKLNASFITQNLLGQTVEYRRKGFSIWTTVRAQVTPVTVSPLGEVLRNTIEIFVSRADVANISIGGDEFRFAALNPADDPDVYRVDRIEEKGPGFYLVRAVKA